MRLLVRAGCDRRLAEAVELALVAEGFSLPGLQDDLERFEESRLALLVGDAERVVRTRAPAAADPEVETSLAQMIECRHLTGHAERVVQRKKLYGRSHPQAPRPGHDPARHQQGRRQDRAGGVDEHLRQPHDVEPPRLARVDELEELAERVALTGAAPYLLREDSEIHARSLSPRSGSLKGQPWSDTAPAPTASSRRPLAPALIVPTPPTPISGAFLAPPTPRSRGFSDGAIGDSLN